MRVLVTGADGFIGKNLLLRLKELGNVDVVSFTRLHRVEELPGLLEGVDWIFHLAGVNRPINRGDFLVDNTNLTEQLCTAIKACGRAIPVVYASSIQADLDNDYGNSKLASENFLLELQRSARSPLHIYRLPNVFGKWAKPDYNSVVATFCHRIARDIPIEINDPSAVIRLVYIDDLIDSFVGLLSEDELINVPSANAYVQVSPEYQITVGRLAEQLSRFRETRDNLISEPVGAGLVRALYSTYVSYLPPERFSYSVRQHNDARGVFVEMLKTLDAGQFSFFTAYPGVTRGGHYHHSKTEKFLVIKGNACFRFRHLVTGESYQLHTSGDHSEIVETAPGWIHDVTNEGNEELICILWANEIFDQDKPDTFPLPLS